MLFTSAPFIRLQSRAGLFNTTMTTLDTIWFIISWVTISSIMVGVGQMVGLIKPKENDTTD